MGSKKDTNCFREFTYDLSEAFQILFSHANLDVQTDGHLILTKLLKKDCKIHILEPKIV